MRSHTAAGKLREPDPVAPGDKIVQFCLFARIVARKVL